MTAVPCAYFFAFSLTWSMIYAIRYRMMDDHSQFENIPGLRHSGGEPHLLRELMRTYQVLLNVFPRQIGMPAARLALLRLLVKSRPKDLGVLEISRILEINAAAVTRQVQEMEKQRLVTRRGDPKDGRRSNVHLTAKGLEVFEEAHDRIHEFEMQFAAQVKAADIATAATVLFQLRSTLEGLR